MIHPALSGVKPFFNQRLCGLYKSAETGGVGKVENAHCSRAGLWRIVRIARRNGTPFGENAEG